MRDVAKIWLDERQCRDLDEGDGVYLLIIAVAGGYVFTYGGMFSNPGLYGRTESEPFKTIKQAVKKGLATRATTGFEEWYSDEDEDADDHAAAAPFISQETPEFTSLIA